MTSFEQGGDLPVDKAYELARRSIFGGFSDGHYVPAANFADIAEDYLKRHQPWLSMARDLSRNSLARSAPDKPNGEMAEWTGWGIDTACFTFMMSGLSPLPETDDIEASLIHGFDVAGNKDRRKAAVQSLTKKNPGFGAMFANLRSKSLEAVDIETSGDASLKLSRNQRDEINAFQSGAFGLYFAVAGAVGLLDGEPAPAQEKLFVPMPYGLRDVLQSSGNASISMTDASAEVSNSSFDPNESLGDIPVLLSIYERLTHIDDVDRMNRTVDAKGVTIVNRETVDKMEEGFQKGCAVVLNTLDKSTSDALKNALLFVDTSIIGESLEASYDMAKSIILGGEDGAEHKRVQEELFDRYPVLKNLNFVFDHITTDHGAGYKTGGYKDPNKHKFYLVGGLSVFLLLASYAEQVNPERPAADFLTGEDSPPPPPSTEVIRRPAPASPNPGTLLRFARKLVESHMSKLPASYQPTLIEAIQMGEDGQLSLHQLRAIGRECRKAYNLRNTRLA